MKMDDICVSAPGKLILHGEHAVVYGKKALATSLDLRTYLSLQVIPAKVDVHVIFPDINTERQWTLEQLSQQVQLPLCKCIEPKSIDDGLHNRLKTVAGLSSTADITTKDLALIAVLYLYLCISYNESDLPGVRIEIRSNLPTGAGLGSSAAFSTCLATGLLLSRKLITPLQQENGTTSSSQIWSDGDLELINKWSFQAERIIHGNPSGIDNSVSTFGGAITFCKGQITPMTRLPKLRIILFNTKQSRSTKHLVAGVRKKYDKFPGVMEPVMCSTEAIAEKCISVLASQNDSLDADSFTTLTELISMNQQLLELMSVGHPKLRAVCDIASKHGLCAKLTGAGGGGCAFALLPQDFTPEAVKVCIEEAQSAGFDAWETSIGGEGVKQHCSLDSTLPFTQRV